MGTGWVKSPYDSRDASWDTLIGAVAEIPPKTFTRPVPQYLAYQNGIQGCVWCSLATLQEYGSKLEDHHIQLSWRYGYANTPGGSAGRDYRTCADWLKKQGIPEYQYCLNDVSVGVNNFLNISSVTQEGKNNSSRYQIKNYSFVGTDISNLKSACYRWPIAIAFPGNNADWTKPASEIVHFTGKTEWYHSTVLWDWTENYIGILNWWGDRYRILANDYPIVAALSVEDLPDDWNKKQMKILGDKSTNRQYSVGDDNILHWIFDEAILEEMSAAGLIDKTQIDWKDNLAGFIVGSPWAALK